MYISEYLFLIRAHDLAWRFGRRAFNVVNSIEVSYELSVDKNWMFVPRHLASFSVSHSGRAHILHAQTLTTV